MGLPDHATCVRLYVSEGMSATQIGVRYGVQKESVERTMKNRARRHGTPWPLKAGRPGARRRANILRWDSVDARMIRAEIAHARATMRLPVWQLAEVSGVSPDTLWQIGRGSRIRVSRATASAIMAAILKFEDSTIAVQPTRRKPATPPGAAKASLVISPR